MSAPKIIAIPQPLARRRRWLPLIIWTPMYAIVLVLLVAGTGYVGWRINPRGPVERTEIYQGVYYLCEQLPETSETSGLMHVIEVDLTAPDIELFLTPPDPQVVEDVPPWTYRLRYVWHTAYRENLAAATNATFFDSRFKHRWPNLYLPGDVGRTVQTIVSEHHVTPDPGDQRLLWFEDDLTPHLTDLDELKRAGGMALARWGIGSARLPRGYLLVRHGEARYWPRGYEVVEQVRPRTAIGIDAATRRMWLITMDHAIPNALIEPLMRFGASDAIILDGGKSSAMVLGRDAQGVRPGRVAGGTRAVATMVGVRARPLPR